MKAFFIIMSYWYKKNKIQQLRGFCKVMEEGSILKASKVMNIAQSSVSIQISSLEKELKIKLFIRKNQKLIATDEAKKFYRMSKKFIEEMDFMFEHANELIKEDYDNTIKIASHPYILSHILPPAFKKILQINDKIKFELFNVSFDEAIDMLNNGSIDIAIFPAENKSFKHGIIAKEFYKCKFGILVSKNHPLANIKPEDITWNILAKHDYIAVGKSVVSQNSKSALETFGMASKFALHNGTWEICLGIIKAGLSVGGGDKKYAEGHSDIIFKECSKLMPEYKFHILLNNKTEISKASQSLLDALNV